MSVRTPMNGSRKVTVTKDRQVVTYAELWHTSRCLLKKGQDEAAGSFHQYMASLVFTAFTLEAYLNHIGPKVFQSWEAIEWLGPKDKLDILAEKIGVTLDYGKRPWGIVKDLFGFRNYIAHGKSVEISETKTTSANKQNDGKIEFAKTPWEKFCTRQNAERARKDIEAIVRTLHEKAGINHEYPFVPGFQFTSEALAQQ
jgi:hypothetical protein